MRLRDSLSNLSRRLLRLMKALETAEPETDVQVEPSVTDPASTTSVRECRMLSPEEVDELVEAYRRGAKVRVLARTYGVHRHTVDRHLKRAGVSKRPVAKMTPGMIDRARELYEQVGARCGSGET